MKTSVRKILVALIIGLLFLTMRWVYILRTHRVIDLSEANCQPSDLGGSYIPVTPMWMRPIPSSKLEETPLKSHIVFLEDRSLSFVHIPLSCAICRFEDENTAHRAFENVCLNRTDSNYGEESCDSDGFGPKGLAFRRDEYLVLISGDASISVNASLFAAARAVDERLR